MHTRSNRLSLSVKLSLVGFVTALQACTSPLRDAASDPEFGQSVRAALRAQELPARPRVSSGVPFVELEQALDSQQKARPPAPTVNRTAQNATARPLGQ